jgi:hypothetical protein
MESNKGKLNKTINIEFDNEDLKSVELDFRGVALKTMKFILKELNKQDLEDKIVQDLFTIEQQKK